MGLKVENRTRLGSELKDKLWDVFEDNSDIIRRVYILRYNNGVSLLVKFKGNRDDKIKDLEKSIEDRLGYKIKVSSMSIFDIGKMNWQEPGVSKEIRERMKFLYEISYNMELIYDECSKNILLEEDKLYW